jgi:hypothetical protein
MNLSEQIFQAVAEWSKGQEGFPPCTKDPIMLKAYIVLLLTAKCQDSRLELLYTILQKSYRTLIYAYHDRIYKLRDDIYEYAVEGEDIQAKRLKTIIKNLEKDHSKLKTLFYQFNRLGIY